MDTPQQSSRPKARASPGHTAPPARPSAVADASPPSTQSVDGSYATECQAYCDAAQQHGLQEQRLGAFGAEPWEQGNRPGALPYQTGSPEGYYYDYYGHQHADVVHAAAALARYGGEPATPHDAAQQQQRRRQQQQQDADLLMVGSWAAGDGRVAPLRERRRARSRRRGAVGGRR